MKHLLSPIFYLLCLGSVFAQGTVRVDNATKVVTDPPTLWTANGVPTLAGNQTYTGSNSYNGSLYLNGPLAAQQTTNFENVRMLSRGMGAENTSTTIWMFGDSYANNLQKLNPELFTARRSIDAASYSTLTGNASILAGNNVLEFPGERIWPGQVLRLEAGDSARLTNNSFHFQNVVDGIRIVALSGPGLGNYTLEFSANSGSSWSTLGNVTMAAGNTTWTGTSHALPGATYNKHRRSAMWRITAQDAPVIVGAAIVRMQTLSGVHVVQAPDNVGGWEWEADPFDPDLFASAYTAMGANGTLHVSRNLIDSYSANGTLAQILGAVRSVDSNAIWIEAGNYYVDPSVSTDAQTDADVAIMRQWAMDNGAVFWDRRSLIGPFASASADGLLADTIHLAARGGRLCASNFWSQIAPRLPGYQAQMSRVVPGNWTARMQSLYGGLVVWPNNNDPGNTPTLRLMSGNHTHEDDGMDIWFEGSGDGLNGALKIGFRQNTAGAAESVQIKRSTTGDDGSIYWPSFAALRSIGTSAARLGRFYTSNMSANGTFTFSGPQILLAAGNLTINATTSRFQIRDGSNAPSGTATLVNGTITVSNNQTATTTKVLATRGAVNASTAIGQIQVTPATGNFTLNSLSANGSVEAGDQSTVNWLLVQPAP